MNEYNIKLKDAKTMVSLDCGRQLDYFDRVLALLAKYLQDENFSGTADQCLTDPSITKLEKAEHAKTVANWYVASLVIMIEPQLINLPG